MAIKIIGKAVLADGELRCTAPRANDKRLTCHKLMALVNRDGEILGKYLCTRCHSKCEVIRG